MNNTYVSAQGKASAKFKKYGGEVKVYRKSTPDPVTGLGGTETLVGEGYALQSEYRTSQIDGEKIKLGDKRLLTEATIAVDVGDRVTFSGKSMAVIRVEEVNPDGQTLVLSKVQVRG